MTGKDLFREIGNISEKYVTEAEETKRSVIHNVVFRRSLATAACLVVCVGLYFATLSTQKNESTAQEGMSEPTQNMAMNGVSEGVNSSVEYNEGIESEDLAESIFGDSDATKPDNYEATMDAQPEMNLAEKDVSEEATTDFQGTAGKEPIGEPERGLGDDYLAVKEKLAEYPEDFEGICRTEAFVVVHGKVNNGMDRWEAFVSAVNQGDAASVDIVQFTVEGDPIITYVYYNGSEFYVVTDYTRDAWGTVGVSQDRFTYMNVFEEENYVEVVLSEEKDLTKEELQNEGLRTYYLVQYNIE